MNEQEMIRQLVKLLAEANTKNQRLHRLLANAQGIQEALPTAQATGACVYSVSGQTTCEEGLTAAQCAFLNGSFHEGRTCSEVKGG